MNLLLLFKELTIYGAIGYNNIPLKVKDALIQSKSTTQTHTERQAALNKSGEIFSALMFTSFQF